ncbi:hypothetical protein KIH41_01530 [Litoribacter ruber]|uniref:hypothetical protein n=1 Tax=Litoribacter ruber TaxID=702568 RepID=UPI001BD98CE9|nr:hypothetical protein [Litoribacter ruber]MBT0809957.1 hypothetical protein [Litoribacter ruber]
MRILSFATINTFTLFIVLYFNYQLGVGNGSLPSVGEVSEEYNTLFTPAGYAFSIWGLIYIMLLFFIGNQWYAVFTPNPGRSVINGSVWFFLSNAMNTLWIVSWTMEYIFLSGIIMLLLLFCLWKLVRNLGLELYDAEFKEIFFVWWPIAIYFGWIVVATATNFAVIFKYVFEINEWIQESTWVTALIFITVIVFLWLTYWRNLRESCLVGTWGLAAIAVKQWGHDDLVAFSAMAGALILFLAAGIHALQNFRTLPFVRLFQEDSPSQN